MHTHTPTADISRRALGKETARKSARGHNKVSQLAATTVLEEEQAAVATAGAQSSGARRRKSYLSAPRLTATGAGGGRQWHRWQWSCQQATTCRRRGVAYLRRAPAPCATERPPRWRLLAGWLLAGCWLPCLLCVTEYRIDAVA